MGADKITHAVAGAIVALVALAFTGSPIMAVLAAVFVGVAKEAWDATGHGSVDLWDFAATALGGAAISIIGTIWTN